MALGKPVIATGYSGNLEFMTQSNSLLVRHRMVEIENDVGPYRRGALWAEPDVDHAAELMSRLAGDPDWGRRLGQFAKCDVDRLLDPTHVGAHLRERLQEMGLNLNDEVDVQSSSQVC
jgi:hypothetical protein